MRLIVALWVLLGAGCGNDEAPPPDGGDAGDGATLVPPPEAPLLDCPTGWVAGSDSEGPRCDAWAGSPPATCADDEAVFVGETGCVRVGSPCPSGEFADDLPTDVRVYYVSAGAAPGGDGSEAAPFAAIGDALGRAFAGSVIAIGKGTYDGVLRPNAGVTLWGACTAETVLTNSTAPDPRGGVVEPRGADTVVRNLRITPTGQSGVSCLRECGVHLEDVVVSGASGAGIGAGFGASVTARSLVVRDTEANGGFFGRGITVDSTSTAEIRRATFERNTEVGVGCYACTLTLEDAYVRETRAQPADRDFGRGISVEMGGTAELRRIVLDRNLDVGLFVHDGGSVVAEDLVVLDTQPQEAAGISGRGISVQQFSTMTLRRAQLDSNREASIWCGGDDASLEMEDVVVKRSLPRLDDDLGGRGIAIEIGCTASLTRGLVFDSNGGGISALGSGPVSLTDVEVRTVVGEGCDGDCTVGGFGTGIGAYGGTVVTVQSFRIVGADLCGVQLASGAAIDLTTGSIEASRIGACVQVEGFDLERLQNDVVYLDNVTNLEATSLPVPMPLGGL